MNPVDVLNQINRLTTDVIKVGICEAQNFPSMKSYPWRYQRDRIQFFGQFHFSEEYSLS